MRLEWSSKCKSKSWMVVRFQSTTKLKLQFEFVLGDTEEFKFNQNLNLNLYREIPMNLSFSIWTSWLKSPHHSGFWFAFRWSFSSQNSCWDAHESFAKQQFFNLLFRRIRTFPQLFRFGFIPGNSGIQQIVRHSMLMGRWREGRILINLCGKNNVRNCDLFQRDFFVWCRTVLGRAKGFFWRV